MSKTVDQRVVEMRFDNTHFEKNVSQTMSTLDKLKAKLNFKDNTKGLENLGDAAKKVDMNGLSNAVQTVQARFSALQVVGITALSRLTNAAITYGNRIANALFIAPVTTGWSEYELKMGSIQTIMASTGKSLEEVNGYLNELNEYSDKTIYSFSDMTQNIGKFTNAGVELEDAVLAIKGISNAAALSGANANEASRAMYNLAQALSAGYVKLIDWKSIELANMATVGFKEQLIASAVAAGTLTDAGNGMYRTLSGQLMNATYNFNESLQDQWMTTEVLIGTLRDYADETTEIGAKATAAATEVKTFSQMFDSLKESAQSGWAQTWEIIFGDFEEGKTLWTSIYKVIDGLLSKMSDFRNNFLKTHLTSNWEKLTEKIQEAGFATDVFENIISDLIGVDEVKKLTEEYGSLSNALKKGKVPADILNKALKKLLGTTEQNAKSTEDYAKIVEDVIAGKYGNGEERLKRLTAAGYNYYKVQNLVNEKLGESFRYTEELTKSQLENADSLATMTDEQLKEIGMTEEQIAALRELKKAADEGGTSINDLIDNISKVGGRDLLIDSFKNIYTYLSQIFGLIGEAWNNVFNNEGDPSKKYGLYELIEDFHDLTESMTISEETANNFRTVMEGLFSGFELTGTIASKSVVGALKILNAFLGLFKKEDGTSFDILDVAAKLADYIIKFNDWVETETMFGWDTAYSDIANVLKAIYDGIVKCVTAFTQLEFVQDILENIKQLLLDLFGGFDGFIDFFSMEGIVGNINDLFENISKWIKGMDSAEEIGTYIVQGLANGIKHGFDLVWNAITEICTTLITIAKTIFGIESPSKVFFAIGGFLIMGLLNGLSDTSSTLFKSMQNIAENLFSIIEKVSQNGIPYIIELFSAFGGKLLEIVKNMDLDIGKIIVAGTIIGVLYLAKKLIDILKMFATPIKGIGKLTEEFKSFLTTIGDAAKIRAKGEAIKAIATAIAIMAAALIALSFIDWKDLAKGGVAIIGLVAALVVLMKTAEKLDNLGDLKTVKISGILLGLASSMVVMALAVKLISGIDFWSAVGAMGAMVVMMGIMLELFEGFGMIVRSGGANDKTVKQVTKIFTRIAGAFVLMALTMKILGGMSGNEFGMGMFAIGVITAIMLAMVAVSKIGGDHMDQAGQLFMKMGIAVALMAVAMKMFGNMTIEEIQLAVKMLAGIGLVFAALIGVSAFGNYADKAGALVWKMGLAIMLMAVAVKMFGNMSMDEVKNASHMLSAIAMVFSGVIAFSLLADENATKAGWLILQMAAAIGILALAVKLLGNMDIGEVIKGSLIIAALGAMISAFITLTKFPEGEVDKAGAMLFKMAGAILILTAAITVLSLLEMKDIVHGTLCIAALMGMMALMIKATNGAQNIEKTILNMAIAIGVMAGAIGLLALIPDQSKVVTAAASIGAVMAMFALLVASTKHAKSSIGTILVLTLAVAALGGILYLLAGLPVESTLATAAGLSILLLSLSASFAIIGLSSPMATAAIPALAAMVIAVGLLAVILGVLTALDCAPSIETALALSTLLLAMSAACLLLAAVGTVAPLAIAGALALDGVILVLGALIVGIGALMEKFPTLETFLDKGLSILEKLSSGLGTVLASFIVNFGTEITSSLPQIGTDLSTFMTNLQPFIDGSKQIDGKVSEGVERLAKAILALTATDIISGLASWFTNGSSLSSFTKDLASISNIDTNNLGSAIDGIERLVKMADDLEDNDFGSMKDFGKALKKVAEDGVSKFVKAFADAYSKVEKAAEELIGQAKTGVENKQKAFNKALTTLVTKGVNHIKTVDNYKKFKGAGQYLAEGFANGINCEDSIIKVKTAATVMANAAKKAAEKAAGVQSPSVVFYGIGKFVVAGFVNALKDGTSQVYKTSADMADSATNGFESAIGKLKNAIDLDIDPNPTIRPVLDLTDIKAGSAAIDGMFGANPTVGIMSNVRAINNAMNQRNQNGSNKDVISAIKDLKDGLSTRSGDTYNLNGITYQEGTEVADAISVLARAVKMEGRM